LTALKKNSVAHTARALCLLQSFEHKVFVRVGLDDYTIFVDGRDQPKFDFSFGCGAETGIFLVAVTAVIVNHGFGLLSVTAETTTRLRHEPKLSRLAIR